MPQGAIGPKQPLSSTEDRLAMVQRAQRMPMNEGNQGNADHVVRVSVICFNSSVSRISVVFIGMGPYLSPAAGEIQLRYFCFGLQSLIDS